MGFRERDSGDPSLSAAAKVHGHSSVTIQIVGEGDEVAIFGAAAELWLDQTWRAKHGGESILRSIAEA
jgi:hypothetical protein